MPNTNMVTEICVIASFIFIGWLDMKIIKLIKANVLQKKKVYFDSLSYDTLISKRKYQKELSFYYDSYLDSIKEKISKMELEEASARLSESKLIQESHYLRDRQYELYKNRFLKLTNNEFEKIWKNNIGIIESMALMDAYKQNNWRLFHASDSYLGQCLSETNKKTIKFHLINNELAFRKNKDRYIQENLANSIEEQNLLLEKILIMSLLAVGVYFISFFVKQL